MNDFQITSTKDECRVCEELGHEIARLKLRLAKIEQAADAAQQEIFNGWAGQAYELWKVAKGTPE